MAKTEVKINSILYKTESNLSFTVNGNGQTISKINVLIQEGKPIPKANDLIEIFHDSTRVFLGFAGIPTSPKFQGGTERPVFSIPSNNANKLASNRIFNKAFVGTTTDAIINNILTTIMAEENVTAGRIDANNTPFVTYVAPDLNLQFVLDEISEVSRAVWFIDELRQFNFININEMDLNTVYTYTEETMFGQIQSKNNGVDFRNVQIEKTKETTTLQPEPKTVEDGTDNIFTIYPVISAEPEIPRPVVKVNGTPKQVGVNGFDNEDPLNIFLYSNSSTQISVNLASGFVFANTDTVLVEYFGQFDLRVRAQNPLSIATLKLKTGGSGRIEVADNDKSLISFEDAHNIASAKLSKFGQNKVEITLEFGETDLARHGLTNADIKLYNVFIFDFPKIGLVQEKFVIKEVRTDIYIVDEELSFKVIFVSINSDFLKNYGEVFVKYQKEIEQLSIRDDEIVIDDITIEEPTILDEEYFFLSPMTFHTVDTPNNAGHIYEATDIMSYGVEFAPYS